jgi:high-affinity iron transporter
MLLNEALEEYEEGEHEEAMSLVVKAYLDNYEYLELDVKAHDKELNEEIERMLKEELREKIESGAPASEVKALAAEISMKMDTVEVIVPEFPLGLAIAMASIMGMMVLFTRFKPRLIRA